MIWDMNERDVGLEEPGKDNLNTGGHRTGFFEGTSAGSGLPVVQPTTCQVPISLNLRHKPRSAGPHRSSSIPASLRGSNSAPLPCESRPCNKIPGKFSCSPCKVCLLIEYSLAHFHDPWPFVFVLWYHPTMSIRSHNT